MPMARASPATSLPTSSRDVCDLRCHPRRLAATRAPARWSPLAARLRRVTGLEYRCRMGGPDGARRATSSSPRFRSPRGLSNAVRHGRPPVTSGAARLGPLRSRSRTRAMGAGSTPAPYRRRTACSGACSDRPARPADRGHLDVRRAKVTSTLVVLDWEDRGHDGAAPRSRPTVRPHDPRRVVDDQSRVPRRTAALPRRPDLVVAGVAADLEGRACSWRTTRRRRRPARRAARARTARHRRSGDPDRRRHPLLRLHSSCRSVRPSARWVPSPAPDRRPVAGGFRRAAAASRSVAPRHSQ